MQSTKNRIPVFYSVDDNYLPFLAVSIRSLIDNLSPDTKCEIYVLNNGLSAPHSIQLTESESARVKIRFVDVSAKLVPLAKKLNLRDYYTASIYFRLFIPSLFPKYKKAVYIDADTVINGDITQLYRMPIGNRLVAAAADDIIASCADFRNYAQEGLGIPYREYFNSGVLLMNLEQFRLQEIEDKFVYLLNRYHFDTVCPDQDYLNVLCRDQVLFLDKGWNKMSIDCDYDGEPNLIHYNMFFKPWQYDNICYGDYFWKYAERTDFLEEIQRIRDSFGESDRQAQAEANQALHQNAVSISRASNNFRCIMPSVDWQHFKDWMNVNEA